MNKIFLAGNLGKDPELRYTSGGTAVAKFSMATTETYKGQKKTSWHTIIAWGKLAEIVAKWLVKGSYCIIIGKLGYNTWEKDGKKITQAEITADEINFGPKTTPDHQQTDSGGSGGPEPDFPF